MSKIKLILRPDEFSSFTSFYLQEFWRQYFDIELFDNNKFYHANSTLFVVWHCNANDSYSQNLKSLGYKVVIDNLWEQSQEEFRNNYYELNNSQWFWYNESLWWRSLGYNNYFPKKNYKKMSFMAVNRASTERNIIIDRLGTRLENFIWSYKDKQLPNDVSCDDPNYQRFFNPDWYDSTWMSLVIESSTNPERCSFLTEKIYKPCAYYHPFVVVGSAGMLNTIKGQGFETFDNLFDESYDQIESFNQRLSAIIDLIDSVQLGHYDSMTHAKIAHNHNHFFDQQLIKQRIIKEIIEPLLHYAET